MAFDFWYFWLGWSLIFDKFHVEIKSMATYQTNMCVCSIRNVKWSFLLKILCLQPFPNVKFIFFLLFMIFWSHFHFSLCVIWYGSLPSALRNMVLWWSFLLQNLSNNDWRYETMIPLFSQYIRVSPLKNSGC